MLLLFLFELYAGSSKFTKNVGYIKFHNHKIWQSLNLNSYEFSALRTAIFLVAITWFSSFSCEGFFFEHPTHGFLKDSTIKEKIEYLLKTSCSRILILLVRQIIYYRAFWKINVIYLIVFSFQFLLSKVRFKHYFDNVVYQKKVFRVYFQNTITE